MNDRDRPTQRTELIYLPSPSWAPAFLALGIALAVCGTFAQGFMVRGWVWSILGAVIALAALRAIVASATRDFYRLPRRQRVRGAVLPVTTLRPPRRG
jgi:hypothetical protein